jgi:hypothetical protein
MVNLSPKYSSPTRKCPKTKDGKEMCMKFLIRGFCDPSCTTPVDKKAFDKVSVTCREETEGAMKSDF